MQNQKTITEKLNNLSTKVELLQGEFYHIRSLAQGNYDIIYQIDDILHSMHSTRCKLMNINKELSEKLQKSMIIKSEV